MKNRFLFILCLSLFSICAVADDEGKEFLRKANEHYKAGYYDVAVGYYLKAAEFNEVEAMFNLGYALYQGEGIIQDYP
jgi:TPR repeat protein